jgi:DNA-directed RNA polymerase I, II, and III subunit RPABC1
MENFTSVGEDYSTTFKIRKTILSMLKDRGYIVSAKDTNEIFEDWKKNYKSKKESLCFLVQKSNDDTDYIYVEYSDSPKLGVQDICNFAERLHKQGVRNGILVLKGSITALAKQVIFSIYHPLILIENTRIRRSSSFRILRRKRINR